MKKFRFLICLASLGVLALLGSSGRLLVINQPRKSDVIVVLAGEAESRPAQGLQLLRQGYAPRMILNVPAGKAIYRSSQLELARKYIEELPEARSIAICPIYGQSTKDEAKDVARCLQ